MRATAFFRCHTCCWLDERNELLEEILMNTISFLGGLLHCPGSSFSSIPLAIRQSVSHTSVPNQTPWPSLPIVRFRARSGRERASMPYLSGTLPLVVCVCLPPSLPVAGCFDVAPFLEFPAAQVALSVRRSAGAP